MPVGLTVEAGWPWWAITAIASAVFGASLLGLVFVRHAAARTAAAILAVEGAVIAISAPFAMSMSSSGAPTMARQPADSVIHVIEHAPAPDMEMSGNVQVFANPIYDGSNKKRVGRDQGICGHVRFAKTWECVWTTFLPGGQITAEGPESDTEGTIYPFAITGGTGMYANARGWLKERTHNKAGTQFDEFFHVSG